MKPPFRVVSWNVRASMTDRVIDTLVSDDAVDLYVLSEYRVPKAGDRIAERLHDAGWIHALRATIPEKLKGVALFSKSQLVQHRALIAKWTTNGHTLDQWLVSAHIPDANLSVIGAYVPYPDGPLKEAVWGALIGAAKKHGEKRLIIAGDFNSAWSHEADTGTGYTWWSLDDMAKVATDLWRHSNTRPPKRDQITWEGPNGKGNRIDFAFGTRALLPALSTVRHRHDVRQSKISDHSQIVIEVAA